MIIEVDEYKKEIPGYTPEHSENFHEESGKLADKDFVKALRSGKHKKIVLMAGGTASGKTEYAISYLNEPDELVYDATLKDFKGFKVKMDKVKRYDKNNSQVKVVFVMPQYWDKAFGAFLSRERKMRPEVFFETQIKSKLTIAKILKETKTDVEIYISDVTGGGKSLNYTNLVLDADRETIAADLVAIAKDLHGIALSFGLDVEVNYDNL